MKGIKVGRNSIAVVDLDFESKEDQVGVDIRIIINAVGDENVEPDSEEDVESMAEEATSIVIAILRSYAEDNDIPVGENDFTVLH